MTQPSQPLLTVFTATVYPDIVRLWHACVTRTFPAPEVSLEIFADSDQHSFDPVYFPGTTILSRTQERRDFQEAYNEAVTRVSTPYLALNDCDIFWISPTRWPWVRAELERPEVAAVSCVSRFQSKSHGTYAVVMKTDVYRQVLQNVPGGFCQAIAYLDPAVPIEQWRWHDTGDRVSQAVLDAGYEIKFLHLEDEGSLIRFENITIFRMTLEYTGLDALARTLGDDRFFWRGYLGNLVLKELHDRVFPDGPRYAFPFGSADVGLTYLSPTGRQKAQDYLARLRIGAQKVEAFIRQHSSLLP